MNGGFVVNVRKVDKMIFGMPTCRKLNKSMDEITKYDCKYYPDCKNGRCKEMYMNG